MKNSASRDGVHESSEAADASERESYVLRLYVTGTTAKSVRAIANIKKICEEHLHGRYTLEVIDIYQRPVLAKTEQILAAPTLVKLLPGPLRQFIGDLADTERVLLGLDLRPDREHNNRLGEQK